MDGCRFLIASAMQRISAHTTDKEKTRIGAAQRIIEANGIRINVAEQGI